MTKFLVVLLCLIVASLTLHLTSHEVVVKKCCKFRKGLQFCSKWAESLDEECRNPRKTKYCVGYNEHDTVTGIPIVKCDSWEDENPEAAAPPATEPETEPATEAPTEAATEAPTQPST